MEKKYYAPLLIITLPCIAFLLTVLLLGTMRQIFEVMAEELSPGYQISRPIFPRVPPKPTSRPGRKALHPVTIKLSAKANLSGRRAAGALKVAYTSWSSMARDQGCIMRSAPCSRSASSVN